MSDWTDAPAWARGHRAPIHYHCRLLADHVRLDAYERAIRALVRPGDVVLDLGAGTGILGMLAARRGAARVHAVESMEIAEVARALVEHNGLGDVVTVHCHDALELEPVEPVDLVVGEFMGRFLVDDGMLPAVAASAAWMRPGARYCPARIRMMLAPVGHIRFQPVDVFRDPFYGLDLSPALAVVRNAVYHVTLRPDALVGPEVEYAVVDPPRVPGAFDATLELPIQTPARLCGLAGWFEATLAPEVVLCTGPGIGTHWGQTFFPLPDLEVVPGDVLRLRLWLDCTAEHERWHWEGALVRAAGEAVSLAGWAWQRSAE